MYIIYNADGSIRYINLTDFIQQGNNNVNSIFLGVDGHDNTDWAASVYFTLPDGDIEVITPSAANKTIQDEQFKGWEVRIPSSVTAQVGDVEFSVSIQNLDGETLYTYNGTLVVNPSSILPDITRISLSQYNALLQYILSVSVNGAPLATNEEIDELFA